MNYKELKASFSKDFDSQSGAMLKAGSLFVASTLLEIVDSYSLDANITGFSISYDDDDSCEYEIRRIELDDIFVDGKSIYDEGNTADGVEYMVDEYDELNIDLQTELNEYERSFDYLISSTMMDADNIDVEKLKKYILENT